jgi:hypothetical protein
MIRRSYPPHDLNNEKLFPIPLSDTLRKDMEQSPIEFYSTDSPQVTSVKEQKLIACDLQIEAAARNVYIKWLIKIFHDCCAIVPGCEPIRIGPHSGRMTFYMLGILGGGDQIGLGKALVT